MLIVAAFKQQILEYKHLKPNIPLSSAEEDSKDELNKGLKQGTWVLGRRVEDEKKEGLGVDDESPG
jgi:hypothetical protein